MPLISSWPRSVRSRVARGLRYWQIVRIFTQCGLRPLWRGGTSRPASLKEAATGEIMALLPMLRRLPRRMDRITAAVEGGRLRVNVRLLADERDRQTINGWLQLGVLTVLAASAGIMAVALLALKGGPVMTATVSLYQFLGYCLLVICSLLALRVLAAVFRAPG